MKGQFLHLTLFTAAMLLAGCGRPGAPISFERGPVESMVLTAGFTVQNSTLQPWVLSCSGPDNRSFTFQAIVPGDVRWNSGNLADSRAALKDSAHEIKADGHTWVVIVNPVLGGLLAYCLEKEIKLYILGDGEWTIPDAAQLIKGIKLRKTTK